MLKLLCASVSLVCLIQVRILLRQKLMKWWSYWLNSNFVNNRMVQLKLAYS